MDAEERALLLAVAANLEDDTPREAYAEWLEKHAGTDLRRNPIEVQDRAEFIRVQIRLSHMASNDPTKSEVEEKARTLLFKHAEEWTKKLFPLGDGQIIRYHHGFANAVCGTTEAMIAQSNNPHFLATELRILKSTSQKQFAEFLRCGLLSSLTELDLSETILTTSEIAALGKTAMPRLQRLTLGTLPPDNYYDANLQSFLSADGFAQLEVLNHPEPLSFACDLARMREERGRNDPFPALRLVNGEPVSILLERGRRINSLATKGLRSLRGRIDEGDPGVDMAIAKEFEAGYPERHDAPEFVRQFLQALANRQPRSNETPDL